MIVTLFALLPADVTAETKTFAISGSSWLNDNNWSPVGAPTPTDDVLINGGTADMVMTGGSLEIQYINYSAAIDSRQLTLNTTTPTSRMLTLDGSGANPLITHSGGSGTTFTIHPNINTGTAALSLRLNAGGEFNVQNSGASLSINSVITETGGARSINKTGAGTLLLNAANTYTGGTTLTGGTTRMGAANALSSGGLTFAGGILEVNNTINTTSLGALTLTGNSTLSLGVNGASGSLTFASAASGAVGTLTITGWSGSQGGAGTDDRIFFTADPTSSGMLDHIVFDLGVDGLHNAEWLSGSKELVAGATPVPEPINVALALFGIVFAGIGIGRRYFVRSPRPV